MTIPPVKYKLLLFDADSTLRRTTVPGQFCPNAPGEWELLPNVHEILALYDWDTTGFGIASNQGSVALGYLTDAMAGKLLHDLAYAAINRPPPAGMVKWCPHAPATECACRKPAPHMLTQLLLTWNDWRCYEKETQRMSWDAPRQADVTRWETLYVGDQPSDREAADRAGMAFMFAHDFFGWDAPSPVYRAAW